MSSLSLVFEHSHSNSVSNRSQHLFPICISLKGDLPRHLDTKVPLRISLSIPEPYSSFLVPVISEVGDSQRSLDDAASTAVASSDSVAAHTPIADPPFLCLLETFDPRATKSWVDLQKSIEDWMMSFVDRRHETQDWDWGREAYWMAFSAANTAFPNGDWPAWNAAIDLEGPYIQEWLNCEGVGSSREEGGADSDCEIRENIWRRLRLHAWSRYSISF
ncbi:protein kinase [Marasmius crinis-equi]|uniref:Protein kinase n=1 Tax=Marasmius crinis-equi TaxID=585013 RepID=A0ABR3F3Z6_9AGAR